MNKSKKAIYLLFSLMLYFALINPKIAYADIQLDKDAFKKVEQTQSLDTQGLLIFTDYSLELRNRQIIAEEKERTEILNKIFMENNIFGSETTLKDDAKASQLFLNPIKYISKDRDEREIKNYIYWTLYFILSLFIVFTSVYLTKKVRVKFKGFKSNHLKDGNY